MYKLSFLLTFYFFSFQWLIAQNFDIGTKWYYEVEQYVGPVGYTVDYKLIEIIDTTTFQNEQVFVLSGSASDYMLVEDSKVYLWDYSLQDFQLTYDFEETSLYLSDWVDLPADNAGTANVLIDSISQITLEGENIDIQHARISNNGSFENDIITSFYKNIGQSEGGLKLYLGCGLCDFFDEAVTQLRCFESGDQSYSFVDYPCDTSFYVPIVSTNTPIPNTTINISPNPSMGTFYLNYQTNTVIEEYVILTLGGRIFSAAHGSPSYLQVDEKGVFIFQFKVADQWFFKKLVVM
jgi:hypothetical protein